MREIKFRAWDNVDNKMIYLGEDSDYTFEVTSIGIRCTKLGTNPFDYETLEHLNYQQYTGLKDKNGKEIYEGDIVKVSEEYGGHAYSPLVVDFKDSCFVLRRINYMPDYNPMFKYDFTKVYEIVGNIYENPDLIEGNQHE